jgi:FlaA1/EpsC-like NDP-sugar epimerase
MAKPTRKETCSTGDLSALATGRTQELFTPDVEKQRERLEAAIGGKRVLVIGGAGSIGSATVVQLLAFSPAAVHVVDQSENNLAELVRDLRARPRNLVPDDFRTLPLDFGSALMRQFISGQAPYDYVLNFAAIKHVRSEKDVYCVLHMLDTNVLKPARLFRWLQERGGTGGYFCVSTDKAANPVNLMGASKRLMEHVIFSLKATGHFGGQVTSARFANVAFSDGSLLQSWLRRLEKRQPLAVPKATRRFFISLREAGQICLLAAVCAPSQHLLIPRLTAENDLCDLEAIARAVLRRQGFEPRICLDEERARTCLSEHLDEAVYPLLITPLDTSGEKLYEEFVGIGETAVELGFASLQGILCSPGPPGALDEVLDWLEALANGRGPPPSKSDIVRRLKTVVPELEHVETGKNLDQRM